VHLERRELKKSVRGINGVTSWKGGQTYLVIIFGENREAGEEEMVASKSFHRDFFQNGVLEDMVVGVDGGGSADCLDIFCGAYSSVGGEEQGGGKG